MPNSKTLSIMLVMLVLFSGSQGVAQAQTPKKGLTVEAIHKQIVPALYRGIPSGFNWLPKGDAFSYFKTNPETRSRDLWIQKASNGKERMAVSQKGLFYVDENNDTLKLRPSQYEWLPDESGFVFLSQGDVWHFDAKSHKLTPLTRTEAEESEAHVSPNGKWVAFVRDFNLFVRSLGEATEIQLTFDGKENLILNGKLDWVYQEELVGRGKFKAYWWSPDSRYLAYLRFDESPVPHYPLVDWIPYHPNVEMMRYPKAGDANPIVKIGVVPVALNPKTVWMDTGENIDVYFPRVYWLPNSRELGFMRLDRHQQHLEFLFADIATGKSRVILEESDPYWINVGDFVYFLKNKPQFIWGSEKSGYRHLYLFDYQGRQLKQLTSGNWMVDEFEGVDEQNGWIYFSANEKDLRERHIYRVKLNGGNFERLSVAEGTHIPRLSPNGKFFLDYYSHLLTPMEATLYRSDGKRLRRLGESVDILSEYRLSLPEMFTFKGDNGIEYYASMIKPPDFRADRKYPVLIYVYGGPHSQVIRKMFGRTRDLWHQMLAEKGYIVFSMDNRGAWGRGHAWESVIYKHMGQTELSDQLQGVRYLKSLPYVDGNRIGIWGWSYGGYMTLFALTHSKVFRTGISVAPVSDWRDYDTIYTERYMGLPAENEAGYHDSSPVFFADRLHGNLLLVHGTGDDNVHLQNSIQMVDNLVDAGKLFHLMFYPNQLHGIAAPGDQLHLYTLMTHFLDEYLMGQTGATGKQSGPAE